MANLIPVSAKKEIVTEYWFRVGILWCVMTIVALIVVGVLQVPTLLLIKSHTQSFSEELQAAHAMTESFEESEQVIADANQLTALLATEDTTIALSEIARTIETIAGSRVTVQSIQLQKTDGTLGTIAVQGIALTREALADFSTNLESHALFQEADLPFSNLAKDRDIVFNISIIPAAQ